MYRCPTDPTPSDESHPGMRGCGYMFDQLPDHEGFVDCPNCGMFFKPHPQDIIGGSRVPIFIRRMIHAVRVR